MLRHRWQNNMPDCRSRHDRASALWFRAVIGCRMASRSRDRINLLRRTRLMPPYRLPTAASSGVSLDQARTLSCDSDCSRNPYEARAWTRFKSKSPLCVRWHACFDALPRCGQRNCMLRGFMHAPRAKLWPSLALLQVVDASHPTSNWTPHAPFHLRGTMV
jgi:hypothetical protein